LVLLNNQLRRYIARGLLLTGFTRSRTVVVVLICIIQIILLHLVEALMFRRSCGGSPRVLIIRMLPRIMYLIQVHRMRTMLRHLL
jgi:hypothetical protein